MTTKDDLNGLNVGDVIYNEHRNGLFLIAWFDFEQLVTTPDEDHPFIVGREITVDESGVKVSEEDVRVSIAGSKRLTRAAALQMVEQHLRASNDKLLALHELVAMTEA